MFLLPSCKTTGISNKSRESLTLQIKFVYTGLLWYQPRRQRMKETSLFKACIQSQNLKIWQTCTCTSQNSTQPIGNVWLIQNVGWLFARLFLFNVWSVMICPRGWICCFLKPSLKVPSSLLSCPKRKYCASGTKANAVFGGAPFSLIRLLAFLRLSQLSDPHGVFVFSMFIL